MILKFLGFVLLAYIAGGIYLYFIQDKKVFQKQYAKLYKPVNAKKIYFITSDDIKLEGAYLENTKNVPLVLYFGGNANNVIEFIDKIGINIKSFNFIGFNYPGYAGSEGNPCEKCILKYALEIYDKYKPDFLMGRSLGTAVAGYVASRRNVKGVVLITPFDSIENIAKRKYPIYPISFLLKHKFKEYEFISSTKVPVVVIALKNDDVIPDESLENLLKHIKNLKNLFLIEGVKHGFIYEHPKIIDIITKSLNKLKGLYKDKITRNKVIIN
ncbi:MAG: alpha/beta hydrolase [Nautiliaceae bacterium]